MTPNLKSGILPSHELKKAIPSKIIKSSIDIKSDQIQPASIDLRLGDIAYRVRASFPPGENCSVAGKLKVNTKNCKKG